MSVPRDIVPRHALFHISLPSSRRIYVSMASFISFILMYSSAEWERAESPGPSFSDGKRISAWSDRVGEPNGRMPISMQRATTGLSVPMCDDDRRNERAFISLFSLLCRKANTSSLR